ncbi:hypothetical protein DSO57_1006036 [Entomophthora muscae]|uniref:Uncharacterized protein n=1 Tax=Entomophthora muscae TaxID=34485 RepID=A0ACC2T7R8_9FUNG|nr:hypothetical protein DSO57_1006036 [Entomophthora muscae]
MADDSNKDIDVELPKEYSKFRRYLMLLLVSGGGLLSTLASTIYVRVIKTY